VLGETFSVIAMFCLRPVILPRSTLSLNPIPAYSHGSNRPYKLFNNKLFMARKFKSNHCRRDL
jgi:hypothetical protein